MKKCISGKIKKTLIHRGLLFRVGESLNLIVTETEYERLKDKVILDDTLSDSMDSNETNNESVEPVEPTVEQKPTVRRGRPKKKKEGENDRC